MKTIDITPYTASAAADEINNLLKRMEELSEEAAKKLAEEGMRIAIDNFSVADYTGVNDVSVTMEKSEGHTYDVIANGSSVLFIEFGTGITMPDNHPERGVDGLVGHGEYGLKQGANPDGWSYYGPPGSMGESMGKGWSHTKGVPAQMSLYYAKQELEERGIEILKEVFANV